MSGRWGVDNGGGDSSQDFTQATQEECALEPDEYTQVEPLTDPGGEDGEETAKTAEPVPWGRLMRLAGGAAIPLMPRPEQIQGRAMNEVTLGRSKVCEVQVFDRRISSTHCRIYCEAASGHLGVMEVYVEDMSANGTWVNQTTKLGRGARRLLNSGDEIALLNPNKQPKKSVNGGKQASGAGREGDNGERLLEAEDATFTFINLDRNRGNSHGRAGSLSVAETLRTAPEANSPALRNDENGVAGRFGGARKVEDFYDVREMIGHGTSGEVRRAINRATGKQVAVKVIETRKFALTPGLTPKELVQEAEMLKRVDHEYIIKLEDIFQSDQAVYLVMDLVSGGDLFDRIVEKGLYAEDLAQELLFRVLTAVQYLHSQDIVHRDLKPENILLVGRDNDVDVKITDFGLAKRANKEGLKTFCGTPQYFAPEVLKRRNTVLGVGRYGKEADMWSVGVILYILLSGTHPFHTTTLFDQITHASYSMAGPEWEHISNKAKDLVRRLLTENPKDRLTAEQALAHAFISERAGGKPTQISSSGVTVKSADDDRSRGHEPTAAAPLPLENVSDDYPPNGDETNRRGKKRGEPKRQAEPQVVAGRSSSQDTEVSSASADDALSHTSKSMSPAEGGGASATTAPGTPGSPVESVPPRPSASTLPPPHPREPDKVSGGSGMRKKAKKDVAAEKVSNSNSYSQLEIHLVKGNGSEGAGGVSISQESNGTGAPKPSTNSRGVPTPSNGKPRTRPKVSQDGCADTAIQGTISPKAAARSSRSKAQGKRSTPPKSHGGTPGCDGATLRPRSGVVNSSAELADEIMQYSSDDSPTKAKRARVTRGQAARKTGFDSGEQVATPTAGAVATTSGTKARDTNGDHQIALKNGDSRKLDLSKLGPLTRPGAGSATTGGRSNGDCVVQAAAGGAAAFVKESVGGGAPAGSGPTVGISSSDLRTGPQRVVGGRSGRQQPTGANKPQRTMTHLWRRAAEEG